MLKNQFQSALRYSSLLFILIPVLAHADGKLLECQSAVLENGFQVKASVYMKSFAVPNSPYYEYCSGTKGIASIVVSLVESDQAPQGVDATFLDAEGAFRGSMARTEISGGLQFDFETKLESVDYLVPKLKVTGHDRDHLEGTLTFMRQSQRPGANGLEKYRDIPVTCVDMGGMQNQCDYWPR